MADCLKTDREDGVSAKVYLRLTYGLHVCGSTQYSFGGKKKYGLHFKKFNQKWRYTFFIIWEAEVGGSLNLLF